MNRNVKRLILVLVVALLAIACYWVFYSINNPGVNNGGVTGELKSLFPYGTTNTTPTNNTGTPAGPNNANQNGQSGSSVAYNPLIQLSQRSIVGMTVISQDMQPQIIIPAGGTSTTVTPWYRSSIFSKTTLPIVRFAEHGTGYIYDVDARAQNETKQTGTTIIRAYEAYFGDNGDSVVFRYVKNDNQTIETFLGRIIPPADNTSGQYASIKGDFLPENISNLAITANGKNIDYLLPTNDGVSGISIKTDGSGQKQLFSSSFSEWLLDLKQSALTATTKAAGGIPGYVYLIGNTGVFQKILGNINGLTTNISPDGRSLLYSTGDAGKVSTFIRHPNGDSIKLSVSTLAEKCVWNKKSITIYCAVPNTIDASTNYPDDWYQGLAHFQDTIWKIDAGSGNASLVNNLGNNQIDAITPMLDPNENYLFFRNNNDGTPWSLDLQPVPAQSSTSFPATR